MQYSFSDLVTIPDIQRILANFQLSSGISTEIMDMDGQIIVASSSQNMWHELHPHAIRSKQNPHSDGESFFLSKEKLSRRAEPSRGLFKYSQGIHSEDQEIGTLSL